jgi:glutamate 5-kinase
MHGFIVVDAETGARLRRGPTALSAAHVLDGSGRFHAGDRVHIVVRGRDGGQGVLASGVVRCSSDDLARWRATIRTSGRCDAAGEAEVMLAADATLLWTTRS